ncbi:MAG: TRAP transporter small permease subunit [Hyphomicrobiales bacterium]|nr:TRAP transporter small permease subunit [Hyphomicrobiales bacterium]MCP5372316.1 TRAP transporter small permease subunit [Hyphomicrobiales bacterium]
MRRAIIRVSDALDRLCRWTAGACFVAMLVFIAIQVVARYILQTPPTWTEELARFAMVWGGLLGATVAFKTRFDPILIRLFERLREAGALVTGLVRGGAVLIFLVPVLYYSLFGPNMSLARGFLGRAAQRTADTLNFPMVYVALAVPIMALVILVHLAARAAGDPGGEAEND